MVKLNFKLGKHDTIALPCFIKTVFKLCPYGIGWDGWADRHEPGSIKKSN